MNYLLKLAFSLAKLVAPFFITKLAEESVSDL